MKNDIFHEKFKNIFTKTKTDRFLPCPNCSYLIIYKDELCGIALNHVSEQAVEQRSYYESRY